MRGLAAGAHILKGRPHVLQAVAKRIIEFCQGATLHHGPGHYRIEGQPPQPGLAVFGADSMVIPAMALTLIALLLGRKKLCA